MIFDKLEESIKHTPFRTIVDNIYRGKFSNTFTCSKCGQAKDREEIFYSLSVDIKNSKTLPESLKKLIQGETINDFRCDFCNEKADVAKKSWISYCPNVIIIHLQRIVFNMDTFINEKINSRFEFPM
jgi:ubiquitin carboxyl-terminal hydrolase 34